MRFANKTMKQAITKFLITQKMIIGELHLASKTIM